MKSKFVRLNHTLVEILFIADHRFPLFVRIVDTFLRSMTEPMHFNLFDLLLQRNPLSFGQKHKASPSQHSSHTKKNYPARSCINQHIQHDRG